MNLFQHTELARLESHVDIETGEVDINSFNRANIALQDKQQAVVAYIRNQDVREVMLLAAKDEVNKPIDAELKRIKSQKENLKNYLAVNMKANAINQINADNGTFKATLYIDRDESVEWVEGAIIPKEYCTVKEVTAPSKTLARAAIEKGEAIGFAHIVKKDRLEIK